MSKVLDLQYSHVGEYGDSNAGWNNEIYNLIEYIKTNLPVGYTCSGVTNPVPAGGTPPIRRITITYGGIDIKFSFTWSYNQYYFTSHSQSGCNFITVDHIGMTIVDFRVYRYETTNGFVIKFAPSMYAITGTDVGHSFSKIYLLADTNSITDAYSVNIRSYGGGKYVLKSDDTVITACAESAASPGKSKNGLPSVSDVIIRSNNGFYCGTLKDTIYSEYVPGLQFTDGTNNYVSVNETPSYLFPQAGLAFKY